MRKNVGTGDRIVRTLLGIVILVLGLADHGLWCLFGLIPLGTAITGICPAYILFRHSTVHEPIKLTSHHVHSAHI